MLGWLLKSTAKLFALLPRNWAMALARHWGWLLAHVVRLRREPALKALARAFPEKTERERQALYAAVCRHQALNAMELVRFAGGRAAELSARLEVRGLENVPAALARGKGVLILIAHFGNYPLLALAVPKLFGYPLAAIAKPLKNKALNAMWWDLQRRAGVNGIPARNAYRASVRALRDNALVGFMIDQNRPANQGVFVDFFGRLASTTPGLAFMSAQTGAPVVPVFMRRLPDGRHLVDVRPPLEPPPDRADETIRAHTAAYTKIVEAEIRLYPDQWLWLHKRWKSRPPGEAVALAAI